MKSPEMGPASPEQKLNNSPSLEELKNIMEQNNGNLILSGTNIEQLPDDLSTVQGDMDISDTKLTMIPNPLEIGGNLYARRTMLNNFPDNLVVGGRVDVRNSSPQLVDAAKRLKNEGKIGGDVIE